MNKCLDNSTVSACYTDPSDGSKQSAIIHYTYDNEGQPSVRITDLSGVVIPGADTSNTSTVPAPSVNIETRKLCVDYWVGGVTEKRVAVGVFSIDGTDTTLLRVEGQNGNVILQGASNGQYDQVSDPGSCDCDTGVL